MNPNRKVAIPSPSTTKGQRLATAIWNSDEVFHHIQAVIDRVKNEPSKPHEVREKEKKEHEPSLLEVLQVGPDQLQESYEKAHKAIGELEEMLFN